MSVSTSLAGLFVPALLIKISNGLDFSINWLISFSLLTSKAMYDALRPWELIWSQISLSSCSVLDTRVTSAPDSAKAI